MTNDPSSLPAVSEADYNAIELAVMETARGRWFLREFAARNRNADTTMLLSAISRLERTVSGEEAFGQVDRVRSDLVEMATSISGLLHDLENSNVSNNERVRLGEATSALDAIVKTTENATSDILAAAESIQEIAWHLRERQIDEAVCDKIDHLATDIYTACGFQDLTAQRTQKVVRTLSFLEERINALVDLWAGPEGRSGATMGTASPDGSRSVASAVPADLNQHDIDVVIVEPQAVGRQAAAGALAYAEPAFHATPKPARDAEEPHADDDIDFAPAAQDPDAAYDSVVALEAHAADIPETFTEDIMAFEDIQVVIDDAENLEIEFEPEADLPAEEDAPPAKATVTHTADSGAAMSLAQIDALPTTAKALIYG
ncbi:MAG: hypothetical protein NTZ14_14110 [Hyphomicrobiales bacterium]|nr:hypothetical protein [Hyphomicrobiales bacterium]